MIHNQRVFFSDDGTLIDISKQVNTFRADTVTIPYVAGEDYIFIGSDMPFNHKYIDIDTPNDQAAVPSVDIWFSNDWESAVDLIDRTDDAGVALAQSGILQWTTEDEKGWDREEDSEDVTGLSGTVIHGMYWIRISFSASLAAGLKINYIGHKFSDDGELYSHYRDLDNATLKAAIEAGKTDWLEEHLTAAEIIVRDMKRRQLIKSASQILDYELLVEPSVHKVAEIVYRSMGRGYIEARKLAATDYSNAMNIKNFNVDKNKDASLSDAERRISTSFMTR